MILKALQKNRAADPYADADANPPSLIRKGLTNLTNFSRDHLQCNCTSLCMSVHSVSLKYLLHVHCIN